MAKTMDEAISAARIPAGPYPRNFIVPFVSVMMDYGKILVDESSLEEIIKTICDEHKLDATIGWVAQNVVFTLHE